MRQLLRSIKILNVYQINISNNTILIHQISKKLHQVYFYPNSKTLYILIQLDFVTLVTLSRITNLVNVSSRFQLGELTSGMNF